MENSDEKEWVYFWVKGTIRDYLSESKPGNTLERIMLMIRRELKYRTAKISKQQLQEILSDNEFDKYRESQRFNNLIDRCIAEDLL